MDGLLFSDAGTRVICTVDHYDPDQLEAVVSRFGQRRYGYLVTPNADHLIRLTEEPDFHRHYEAATYTLLDSRVVARLQRLIKGQSIPVCTGSGLVERLFRNTILPDDPLVLIGASPQQAELLRRRYGLRRLAHHNPPMGFASEPQEVEACLRFVEANSPFRFCLLAVGSPRQEMLAYRLAQRDRARGLALCIGASIDFLTGVERRAPAWVRRMCLEWMFRLMQSPRRLARRYLVRCPRVFGVLQHGEILVRCRGLALPPPLALSGHLSSAAPPGI